MSRRTRPWTFGPSAMDKFRQPARVPSEPIPETGATDRGYSLLGGLAGPGRYVAKLHPMSLTPRDAGRLPALLLLLKEVQTVEKRIQSDIDTEYRKEAEKP